MSEGGWTREWYEECKKQAEREGSRPDAKPVHVPTHYKRALDLEHEVIVSVFAQQLEGCTPFDITGVL